MGFEGLGDLTDLSGRTQRGSKGKMQRPDERGAPAPAGLPTLKSSAGAHAIGVERVGEEHADTEECKERCDDLGHGRTLIVTMPLRVVLRNCR